MDIQTDQSVTELSAILAELEKNQSRGEGATTAELAEHMNVSLIKMRTILKKAKQAGKLKPITVYRPDISDRLMPVTGWASA